ncbi:hypothetical protein BC940DRAFT_319009 [Gongronella butleri]|nr:hypothetical protein BC940DRAFT_319009 [Gongronella butleri]
MPTTSLFTKINMPNELDTLRITKPQVDGVDHTEGGPGSRERDEQVHLLVGSSKTETLAVTFGMAQPVQDELAALVQQARDQIQRSALCMTGRTLIDQDLMQMVDDAFDEGLCCPQQIKGNARKKPNVINFRRKIAPTSWSRLRSTLVEKAISTALCILFA